MVLLSQNLNMFEIISKNELRYLSTLSAQILFDHFFTNVATRDNFLPQRGLIMQQVLFFLAALYECLFWVCRLTKISREKRTESFSEVGRTDS